MKTIDTSCILCVHLHQVTSPFVMMSMNAYTMVMMSIIMSCMIFEDLLTSKRPTMDN